MISIGARPSGRFTVGDFLRVCAKSNVGQEAQFKQNAPHPDPLPSDGRGNSLIRLLHLLQRLDTPTDGARFLLSHPMGYPFSEGGAGDSPAPPSDPPGGKALYPEAGKPFPCVRRRPRSRRAGRAGRLCYPR